MKALSRRLFTLSAAALLAGCANTSDMAGMAERDPLGAFKLGHVVVVADNVQRVQPSRDVSIDEWESAMKSALEQRFSGYPGDQFYHIAVAVLGYSVAVPGVPVVMAPKSVMVIEASIWDDAAGGKINAEPRQFTIFESVDENFVVGSGLTKSKSEQVANLSANAAYQIEQWMRENEGWFERKE
ncbi:hypothetical protein [Tropicimonas marinistellae]|uniref:hypothetical protein n=1 Tax=Tropicimonas marinistellae TaxID=1739787 RepID=UPI00122E0D9F|nr:hypothetical protein [Tropicimonas marinistellae]